MTDSTQSSTPADDLNEGGARILTNEDGIEIFAAIEDAQRATDQMTIATAKAEQAAQEESEDTPAQLLNTVQILQDALLIATQKLQQYFPPEQVEQITKSIESRKEYIGGLTPYLEKELEQLHTDNPETAAITLEDIANSFDLAGCFEESDLEQLYSEYQEDPTILDGDPVLKYVELVFGAVRRAKAKYTAEQGKKRQPLQVQLLKTKTPKKHVMPIQRLANELQHGTIIGMGAIDLIVANRGKKNEITSFVLATYEQPDGVTMTGKPYTEYDRQVQDAVSSLWEFGDKSHVITPETVFRAMTHRTQTETPSPQQIGAVTKSLEKMRRIHITVDATDEMQRRKVTVDGKRVASCKFDDSLLSLRAVEVKAGGKTVKAYKITAEPVLLTYAKLTKQIATVPAERLDIKKVDKAGNVTPVSISNSDTRIAVKGYILRRIEIMKRDRQSKTQRQSNIILFDSLFEETDTPSKNAERVKAYAFQVFDYYKATGYISGYTKRKKAGKGGGFDAVVIDL